jgi:peptidoglycan/LPS O-acetylase OafA/YrhL
MLMLKAAGSKDHGLGRNSAIDFTKGSLVLFMVVYHWANYFIGVEGFFYRYIRFVSTSFILISGFLISYVYLPRVTDWTRVWGRLSTRGLKLLLIFTVLNVAAAAIVTKNYNGQLIGVAEFVRNAPRIYGPGMGEAAAFDILVPIGYLLLISPLILGAVWWRREAVAGICGLFLTGVLLLDAFDIAGPNITFLGVGVVGLGLGALPGMCHTMRSKLGWFTIAYVLYLAAVTRIPLTYPVQIIGASLSVALLYSVGTRVTQGTALQQQVVLLGRYSLLGYIVQIAALQVLKRLLGEFEPASARCALALSAAIVATGGAVLCVDVINCRSRIVGKFYRFVFE